MVGRSNEIRREACWDVVGRSCFPSRRTRPAGFRAPIRAMKSGNADRAKGCRKVDELRYITGLTMRVLDRAMLIVVTRVRTTRFKFRLSSHFMMTILFVRMTGLCSLPRLGASTTSSLAGGLLIPTPLTGEPYAGKPHVRFGGRGELITLPYPYLSRHATRIDSQCEFRPRNTQAKSRKNTNWLKSVRFRHFDAKPSFCVSPVIVSS